MDALNVTPPFERQIPGGILAKGVTILQINTGYRCNLECRHCHVAAGPARVETMSKRTMEQCIEVLEAHAIATVDITGGSPELHPHLPWFIEACSNGGRRVLVRTNGVILLEDAYAHFLDFYGSHRVEVVISLPSVDPRTTDRQRGDGSFLKVIEAIRRLNGAGYGRGGSGLTLDLVHNPVGAFLHGSQTSLEALYRKTLEDRYGVSFNHLFCITNVPVGRYLDYLQRTDNYHDYMKNLAKSFNPASLSGVMCKSTVSVGWDGRLYDCDFNQMLGLPINHGAPDRIEAFDLKTLAARQIVVGDHCYGCTAGQGSSCQGQVVEG